ncbi:hypothetical protein D3C87_988080 [compost metagenome]
MVLIPDDILFSIAEYGGEPPVDPRRLIENIMEIYPIFSFKREYHLRLLQEKVKLDKLYPVYQALPLDYFDYFDIKSNEDISLKIKLYTIHSILNPLITKSTKFISTRTIIEDNQSLCKDLFSILSLNDSSNIESFEYYLKIINKNPGDNFSLSEVYRQCFIKSNEDKIIINKYITDHSLRSFYDIVNIKEIIIFNYSNRINIMGNELSDIRDKLIYAGFRATRILSNKNNELIDYKQIFSVGISQDTFRDYLELETVKNPYIRRCYHTRKN